MKASKRSIGRAVDQPDAELRFYLFHGPDDAQSRALGDRLLQALGAARLIVNPGTIKSDPASLADEAGAISMFGDTRLIWIEPAGDEIAAGIEALLEAPGVESPVVAIAGTLRRTSALLKLAESSDRAIAFAAYAPEGADAERMVIDVGRRVGLKISPPRRTAPTIRRSSARSCRSSRFMPTRRRKARKSFRRRWSRRSALN